MKITLTTLEQRPLWVALFFVLAALLFRIFSCFPTVLDHDESTYIVIANEWLSGEQLYKDLIDIKPPGIFIIYRLLLSICHSIVFTRMVAAVLVGLSSFLLYWLHRQKYGETRAALWAGASYLVMISTFVWYGLSVNTELYFNFFTLLALFCFTQNQFLLGGLCMGFGFIIKYMVLFDFVAFMGWGIMLWYFNTPRDYRQIRPLLTKIIVASAAMLLPFALCHFYFYQIGLWNEFYYIIYTAPKRYVSSGANLKRAQMLGDYLLRFLPFTFFALYALWKNESKLFRWQNATWLALSTIAVLLPGNRFGHYTVQLMLPTAFLAGSYFSQQLTLPPWLQWRPSIAYAVLGLFLTTVWLSQYQICISKTDIVQTTADYLNEHLQEGEQIYTGNEQQIIYFLTDRNCPIPYVHRSLLFDPKHIHTLQIDTTKVVEQLIALRARYILQNTDFPNQQLQNFVSTHYEQVYIVGNQIRVMRLIDAPISTPQ